MQERLEDGWRRDANSCSTEDRWSSVGKRKNSCQAQWEKLSSAGA